MLPWAELMTVAALCWRHCTAPGPGIPPLLAVALTGYLLAVHLAESGAGASVLRAQLPLLAAGVGLTALAVGAAALPCRPARRVRPLTLIRVSAVVLVAVAVAGLAVPVWLGRSR